MTLERVEIEVPSSRQLPTGRAVRVEASVADFGASAVVLAVGLRGTDAGAVVEVPAVRQLYVALGAERHEDATVLGVDAQHPEWVAVVNVVAGLDTDVVVTAHGLDPAGGSRGTHCTVARAHLRAALGKALEYLARVAS